MNNYSQSYILPWKRRSSVSCFNNTNRLLPWNIYCLWLGLEIWLTTNPWGCDHIEVYGICYTICSPLQMTLKWCSEEAMESGLWWRANCIAYSKYCIAYISTWSQPKTTRNFLGFRIFDQINSPCWCFDLFLSSSRPVSVQCQQCQHVSASAVIW